MRVPVLVTAALVVAALTGCGAVTADPGSDPSSSGGFATVPGPPSSTPVPPSGTGAPTPPPVDGSIPPEVEQDPRVVAALEDARGRAGIVPTDVVLAGYTPVTWNDGSVGCPKKGESYIQMTIEGELLLVRADQRLMSYHSANGGEFTYCATPSDGWTVRTG